MNHRRERYEPMDYKHKHLMKALNEWCITLKVWLYPEHFADKPELYEQLKREHPKPDLVDFDLRHHILHEALSEECKSLIKY